jgi:hypothetical protein
MKPFLKIIFYTLFTIAFLFGGICFLVSIEAKKDVKRSVKIEYRDAINGVSNYQKTF